MSHTDELDGSDRSSDGHSSVTEGERYGHLIRLKPEYRERYIVLHAHPFPGLIDRMREAGLRNYSIFLRDHILFSYYEYVGDDFETDMEAMAGNDTVQDWWTLTDPMQEALPQREDGEWWARMDELYRGGSKTAPTDRSERLAYVSEFREGTSKELRACYREIGDALPEALATANFQNYAVYFLGNSRYSYLEYVGTDLDRDRERLLNASPVKQLREGVEPLLAENAERHPMESVFFMA